MTDQMNQLIQLIGAQNAILASIAEQLQDLAHLQRQNLNGDDGPNYRHQLSEYSAFNWYEINANPTREVGDGINEVSWGGYTWWRRSGTGKFGNAIWFSRAVGKNEDGTPKYARLITFKDSDAPEPLKVQMDNNHAPPQPVNGLEHNQIRHTPPISPSAESEYRDKNEPPTGPPPPQEPSRWEAPPMHNEPPMSEAQAVASAKAEAPPDPKEAETKFYSIVKDAIRSGKVSVRIINDYTQSVKEAGWPAVLNQLQQDIAAA